MNAQVQELDSVHLDGIVGGNPFIIPIVNGLAVGISLAITNQIVSNWDHFKAGLFGELDPTISEAK